MTTPTLPTLPMIQAGLAADLRGFASEAAKGYRKWTLAETQAHLVNLREYVERMQTLAAQMEKQ